MLQIYTVCYTDTTVCYTDTIMCYSYTTLGYTDTIVCYTDNSVCYTAITVCSIQILHCANSVQHKHYYTDTNTQALKFIYTYSAQMYTDATVLHVYIDTKHFYSKTVRGYNQIVL